MAVLPGEPLPEVTADEEQRMRDQHDEIAVTTYRARLGKTLHLVSDGEVVCNHDFPSGVARKPFSAYPPGYRRICRECAEHWRQASIPSVLGRAGSSQGV